MRRSDNKEVAFEVPDDWEDKTVIAFEGPKAPGMTVGRNVTLMRVVIPPGSSPTLTTFATQQVASLASGLPGFELVRQQSTVAGNLPAVEIVYHWKHPEGSLTQRIMLFQRDRTVWSFTATALRGDMDAATPGFEKIFKSLVVHPTGPGAGSAGAPPSPDSVPKPPPSRPRGW